MSKKRKPFGTLIEDIRLRIQKEEDDAEKTRLIDEIELCICAGLENWVRNTTSNRIVIYPTQFAGTDLHQLDSNEVKVLSDNAFIDSPLGAVFEHFVLKEKVALLKINYKGEDYILLNL